MIDFNEIDYSNHFYDSYFKQFIKYLSDDSRVIDYDARIGDTTNSFYNFHKNIEGLCFDKKDFEYAKDKNKNITYYNDLSLINNKYDGVLCINALNDEVNKRINEIFNLINNDGYLFIANRSNDAIIPNLYGKFELIEELICFDNWIFNIYKKINL